MGEKETATAAREASSPSISERDRGLGLASEKSAPEKKQEQERYVQDDTPDGESARGVGKHSPELMQSSPEPPEELSDTGRRDASMSSIRNLRD